MKAVLEQRLPLKIELGKPQFTLTLSEQHFESPMILKRLLPSADCPVGSYSD